ncbi:MAG: hypothetical protein ABI693_00855 [Bryobacteraceae bacterium]
MPACAKCGQQSSDGKSFCDHCWFAFRQVTELGQIPPPRPGKSISSTTILLMYILAGSVVLFVIVAARRFT